MVSWSLSCGAGCSSSAPPTEADAGRPRDASLTDAMLLPTDGAAADAAPPSDGAVVDAAPPARCAGECDPREAASCSGGYCALRDRIPACHPAAGTVGEGGACSVDLLCEPGLACFPGAAGPTCERVCCPSTDTCPGELRCGGDGVLANGATTSWGRCMPARSCDVLDQAGSCPMREGCYIVSASGDTQCRAAGSSGVGVACERPEDCAPGLACAGVMRRACIRICRIDDPMPCPRDEGRCIAQAYSPAGSGVCVTP